MFIILVEAKFRNLELELLQISNTSLGERALRSRVEEQVYLRLSLDHPADLPLLGDHGLGLARLHRGGGYLWRDDYTGPLTRSDPIRKPYERHK